MKKTIKFNLTNMGRKNFKNGGLKQKKLERTIIDAIETGLYPYTSRYAGKCDGYECTRSIYIDKNSNGIICQASGVALIVEPYDNKIIATEIPEKTFDGMTSMEVQKMLMGRENSTYKLWDLWKR